MVLRGCALSWPWWADLGWVLAIADTYSRYFIVPWAAPNPLVGHCLLPSCLFLLETSWPLHVEIPQQCDPMTSVVCDPMTSVVIANPQGTTPRQWVYVNIILERASLAVPVSMPPEPEEAWPSRCCPQLPHASSASPDRPASKLLSYSVAACC